MIFSKCKTLLTLVPLLVMLALSPPVLAENSDVITAEKRVIAVTTTIMALLDKNKHLYATDKNALNLMIRKEILPLIDFDAMSKLTLGKHWKKATAPQRNRFVNAFREMLVRSYATTMLEYTGSTISAGRSSANKKPGYVTIRTLVKPQGDSAIRATYSLRKVGNDWKAYNVKIAGIDLITNFRTNFTREVSNKGLNALIVRLESAGK